MSSLGIPLSSISASRHATTALALLPAFIPVAYVVYTNWAVQRNTSSVAGRLPPHDDESSPERSHPKEPYSLPAKVKESLSEWIVSYERVVSYPCPTSSLAYLPDQPTTSAQAQATQPSSLLLAWLRTTHRAFSWTPQAFIIRSALSEPLNKGSFDAKWIDNLDFKPGDVVNGVYSVSSHVRDDSTGSERAELLFDIPPSYKGPSVRGLILSSIEPVTSSSNEAIIFVNETWMWRRADEKPTLLESPFGKWFHRLLAGWLIMKGIKGVTA
ncbi:hypothetical protein QQS21_003703 [Conoideocrella luteorostrata]|uniref:Uncharacterized protein n=1 Tax=Conoideocrella luteorostrata TaxID=1105319 RepID=A0AAJ0CVR6_9HYPO|nr:hypothetical protein QQS21_003703 [Conoideocrella luteorostrata]